MSTDQPDERAVAQVEIEETPKERLDRQMTELLQGLRVAVTGVQVLFAFLLAQPFTARFERLSHLEKAIFFLALISAAVASICFIAPAAQHRLLFRTGQKDLLVRRSNRFGIAGTVALAVAISSASIVVVMVFAPAWLAILTGAGLAALCGWLWFWQPISATRHRVRTKIRP